MLVCSRCFAGDIASSAVVTNFEKGVHAITVSVRTNGCTLELYRHTNKGNPYFAGHWTQHVYAGGRHLLEIQHSAAEKEQSLAIDDNTGYRVLQIDRNLDAKYEMLTVISLKDQSLTDVLFVTDEGYLRHSTSEEFQARRRIFEENHRAVEELWRTIQDAAQKAAGPNK